VGAYFANDVTNRGFGVDEIRFVDGTVWTDAEIRGFVTQGTAANDVLIGFADGEDAIDGLAGALIEETCEKYGIARDTLTLHSDRGSPMRAKTTAELFVDLGVAASFSRPRVSNDNPFSEAQFKTLKYRPEFPERFAGIAHARTHLREFFAWYNDAHRHSGIGFMTPASVHFGHAPAIDAQRRRVLEAAYAAHPERFKGPLPTPPALSGIVGINLPKTQSTETTDALTPTPALLTNSENQVSQSHMTHSGHSGRLSETDLDDVALWSVCQFLSPNTPLPPRSTQRYVSWMFHGYRPGRLD
jgi:hypothetical protein